MAVTHSPTEEEEEEEKQLDTNTTKLVLVVLKTLYNVVVAVSNSRIVVVHSCCFVIFYFVMILYYCYKNYGLVVDCAPRHHVLWRRLPQPNRPVLRPRSIRVSIGRKADTPDRSVVSLVTFEFGTGFKVKDSDPQIASPGHKLAATGVECNASLVLKVNGHFVLVEFLIGCCQIKKGNFRARGDRQNLLLASIEGLNLHVANLGALARFECFDYCFAGGVPQVYLAVHTGAEQELVGHPGQFCNGRFLFEFERGIFGGVLFEEELGQVVDPQGCLLSPGRQLLRVWRKDARLDNVFVGQLAEALSRNGVPDTGRVVPRGGGRQIPGGVHLAGPHGPLVSRPGSDPVPGSPVPDHGHFIVTGAQQIGCSCAFLGKADILEFGEGSGVAGTNNGDLFRGGNGGRHD